MTHAPLVPASTHFGQIERLNPENPIAGMLQVIAEKGVTADSVGALERLTDLYERMETRNASKAFSVAFAAFQSECPRVAVTKAVPMKGGGVKYKYAPYEDIMEQVTPILERHGFGVTYSTTYHSEPVRVVAKCTLMHTGGHERSSEFSCRVGSGAPGLSAAQEDSAAASMAMRRAFCAVCNIVIEHDRDAKALGDVVSDDEAAELEARCRKAAGGRDDQVQRYLAITGANCWANVRRAGADALIEVLERHERAGGAKDASPAQPVQPDPKQGKPCPASFEDGPAWREAMIVEIGERWAVEPDKATAIMSAMEKKSGNSYLSMSPKDRHAGWYALVNGMLDAKYKPKE